MGEGMLAALLCLSVEFSACHISDPMKVLAIDRPFCSCLVSARLVFLKQRAVCLLALLARPWCWLLKCLAFLYGEKKGCHVNKTSGNTAAPGIRDWAV